LNQSLEWLKRKYDFEYKWIDTSSIEGKSETRLGEFSGIWSAPGSPFRSLNGVIEAIRYARVNNITHLATCGGMQHTIIEFARNVLGFRNAQHEEYDNTSSELFISKLTCSLAGKTMTIRIQEGTHAYNCYKTTESVEDYYCNFGINPDFKDKLNHPDLVVSGLDQDGEIRIIEIPRNDFFVATLFVPQSRATEECPHPIIEGFVENCVENCRI
jgi:CTP synthase (UTP-ammonia lyase)